MAAGAQCPIAASYRDVLRPRFGARAPAGSSTLSFLVIWRRLNMNHDIKKLREVRQQVTLYLVGDLMPGIDRQVAINLHVELDKVTNPALSHSTRFNLPNTIDSSGAACHQLLDLGIDVSVEHVMK